VLLKNGEKAMEKVSKVGGKDMMDIMVFKFAKPPLKLKIKN